MAGLDENYLRSMNSSEILNLEFLRCDSKEDISEEQNMIQEIFLKQTSIGADEPIYVNQPIYINQQIHETIDELYTQAIYREPVDNIEPIYSEPVANEPTYVNERIYETLRFQKPDVIESQQKIESIISEKTLLTIKGNFKKKDTKHLQNIVDWSQSSGVNNFKIYFKLILSDLKKLKSSFFFYRSCINIFFWFIF